MAEAKRKIEARTVEGYASKQQASEEEAYGSEAKRKTEQPEKPGPTSLATGSGSESKGSGQPDQGRIIDVRQLAGSRETIEEEIRTKVSIAKQGGGYIYHSDHSVPHNVSFENYQFTVEMLEKYGKYD
ncbi:MAG: hypothetical protein QGI86_00650 [Candidatus Poribacteria bacterium]|jgi:hypothetical protein|nr:hypothetical protein [Candidatus Poribacteria bacterium]MDP6750396.1 hypothetical protein [Candidatus Poribacteria bacterium]MDP6996290.1 hypothetical protein [Candidatus Poribacteria bacterium]